MKRQICFLAMALLLAMPLTALAADGWVTVNLNMRAGPAAQYPLITTLSVGTEVTIQGCTDGWEWCDVIADGDRGWVDGSYIQDEYDGRRVAVPVYGARLGIPIITFAISSYWSNHYRHRAFYRNRDSWYHRRVDHRTHPRRPERYAPPRRTERRASPQRREQYETRPANRRQPQSRVPQGHRSPSRPAAPRLVTPRHAPTRQMPTRNVQDNRNRSRTTQGRQPSRNDRNDRNNSKGRNDNRGKDHGHGH